MPPENLSRKVGRRAPPACQNPDPPGAYLWGGRPVRYNYARIGARLGTVPDSHLAVEISAPGSLVSEQRRRLGIPRYSPVRALRPWLGRIPDRALARHFSIHAATITRERNRLGIPPADRVAANADARLRSYIEAMNREDQEP